MGRSRSNKCVCFTRVFTGFVHYFLVAMNEQRQRLEDESPAGLDDTDSHLFVDPSLGRIVRANHERVLQGFERMQLQLEKAEFRMNRDGNT